MTIFEGGKMSNSSTKIKWNWETMKWEGITVEQVKTWEKLYPDANVIQQVTVEIPRWLDKMEGKRITRKKDWKRTIVNWLKREQEKRAWENVGQR